MQVVDLQSTHIDTPAPPTLLRGTPAAPVRLQDQVAAAIRVRHYSRRTEQAW